MNRDHTVLTVSASISNVAGGLLRACPKRQDNLPKVQFLTMKWGRIPTLVARILWMVETAPCCRSQGRTLLMDPSMIRLIMRASCGRMSCKVGICNQLGGGTWAFLIWTFWMRGRRMNSP